MLADFPDIMTLCEAMQALGVSKLISIGANPNIVFTLWRTFY
jgi:hypothetical protein